MRAFFLISLCLSAASMKAEAQEAGSATVLSNPASPPSLSQAATAAALTEPASPQMLALPVSGAVQDAPVSFLAISEPASPAAIEAAATTTVLVLESEPLRGYGSAYTYDLGGSLLFEAGAAQGDLALDRLEVEVDAGYFVADRWRLSLAPAYSRLSSSDAASSLTDTMLALRAGFEAIINEHESWRYFAGARLGYNRLYTDRTDAVASTQDGIGMDLRLGVNRLLDAGLVRIFLFLGIDYLSNEDMANSRLRGGIGVSFFFYQEGRE
jgi:hypothetical protein